GGIAAYRTYRPSLIATLLREKYAAVGRLNSMYHHTAAISPHRMTGPTSTAAYFSRRSVAIREGRYVR
ncbi:hypothetical protein, partial [Gordonia sp. 852002-10350_SCH5691597]|uniref:hypothetical protein n=1 Tax=Gordonia sp. 852002-10350_SCH5691597 TaxID=1834085 RepID=UPI000AF1EC81